MEKASLWAFLLVVMLLPLSGPSAYEGGAVSDGGTISGFVKFKGTAPAPKKLDITKDKEVCAKTPKLDPSLIVSDGNLVNAVVYLADIKKGKKMEPQKITLDQKGCEFAPHVLAFPVGSTVEVLNPDGILHNFHTFSQKNSPTNMAQPKFKKAVTVKIEKPEAFRFTCDVHPWMNGWFFAAANPYFSVTDKAGGLKLTDVPPGAYTIEVWHETLGKLSQKVTVKAKEEVKLNFEFAKK